MAKIQVFALFFWGLLALMPGARAESFPLFDRFPSLKTQLPRVVLMPEHTPLKPMNQLERRLTEAHGLPVPEQPSLWVKMDDRSHTVLGGNKIRKLEFILGEAKARNAELIVTSGRFGTHHGLITAAAAREQGMKTRLILGPQPMNATVRRQLLAMHALGAELVYEPTLLSMGVELMHYSLERWFTREEYYYVAPGGSDVLGTIGYANGFLELLDQTGPQGLPEEIYVPVGTAGTAAGLLLGTCLGEVWGKTKIRGVLVVKPPAVNGYTVRSKAKEAYNKIKSLLSDAELKTFPKCDFLWDRDAFELLDHFYGPKYGTAPPDVYSTIALFKDTEGVVIEPTYTGKAAYCMLDEIHQRLEAQGKIGKRILFWQTYNSHDVNELIDAYPWSNPQEKWKDLPEGFWKLFR